MIRDGQLGGRQPYGPVVADLIGRREPVARLPASTVPKQVRVQIYDLRMTDTQTADTALSGDGGTWRR